MKKKEILAFIAENPMTNLGTVDGDKPRVRGMETFRADDQGLIFYTSKKKDVFRQIAKNPEVEACYFARGTQIRVRGRMEIIEDLALKMEIIEKRPFLKPRHAVNPEGMAVMRLRGKATTWTMQEDLEPKTFIDI